MTLREKLDVAVEDTIDVLNNLGIKYGPIASVEINYRAKKRWGQCSYSRKTGKYTIQVSSRLLADDIEWESLLNTLIHEFLHAYTGRMSHTGEWKRLAELVNRKYPIYHISRCSSFEEMGIEPETMISSYKYSATCVSCGRTSYYARKGRVISILLRQPKGACRCGACGGNEFRVKVLH